MSQRRTSVLFICTGNIFRSLVAEYAFKQLAEPDARWAIGSAGIEAVPQAVHPLICARLQQKGIDPSGHRQRKLTAELLAQTDVPVAMGLDHQAFIHRRFGRTVPLFMELCNGKRESVLDIHEAVPDWETNPQAARDYALSVIDYIWEAVPALLAGLRRP